MEEAEAYYYARDEIIARREREAALAVVEPRPFKAWYEEYLRSPEWQQRAAAAKARSGGRCALGNASGSLEAHHRTYERVGEELPEDLIALCADCHRGYHEWRRARPSQN